MKITMVTIVAFVIFRVSTVRADVPVVSADPTNATICEGKIASFSSTANGTPAPQIQWQVSEDDGATFTDIGGAVNSPLTFVTSLSDEQNQYRAVFTNIDGADTSSAAILSVDSASIVDAGPDQTVCATDTIFLHATLSGVATSMVWQLNSAFGVFIGSDTSPDAKFLLNANGRAQTSIKFGAQSNDPGSNVCQGGEDTVVIFINPEATVDAGADIRICSSVSSFPPLDGSIGGAATSATWSGGAGTFSPNANTLDATYVPSPSELASADDITLILTTNDPAGLCPPVSDTLLYVIDSASVVDAGPDQTVCATDTIFLHATLSGVATSMVWQKNVAFGVFIGSDTSPDAKFLLNANGRAQTSIKFGAQSNDPGSNVCQGGEDTVVIFINPCLPNPVQNASFESGTSPWVFFTNASGNLTTISPGPSSPNAAKVTLNTIGSNMQLYQSGITLQPNTQYRLTFKALSSVGHNLSVFLQRHTSPFTPYGINGHVFDLTPSWQTFTLDFTTTGFPPPTPSNARLRFRFDTFATPGDVYYIDDVTLEQLGSALTATKVRVETAPDGGGSIVPAQTIESGETITMYAISRTATDQFVANVPATWSLQDVVPNVVAGDLVPSGDGKSAVFTAHLDGSAKVQAVSGALTTTPSGTITVLTPPPVTNLLLNGGFESGTSNWTFNTNGTGSFSSVAPGIVGAKAGQVSITTAGTIVQLFQPSVSLSAGNEYRLSFKAFSTTGHDVQVSVFKHASPFTPYGLTNQFFNLTNAWAEYSVDFFAGGFVGSVNDARLRFWLAPYDAPGDVYQFDDVKLELLPAPADGGTGIVEAQVPSEFTLAQNFPNPFNPSTTIIYTLPVDAHVTLEVIDMLGQRVAMLAHGSMEAGYHDAVFNASANASGMYFYRLIAAGVDGNLYTRTEKMLLAK